MESFDLDQPIIELVSATGKSYWTIRHAVEGVQIFGGIGSGKTSGSGRMLALKYLKAGFGGLVLTVKPDEKKAWQDYCQLTGRTNDLIIREPGGKHSFNFLQYDSARGGSQGAITENIVDVLKTVLRAGEEKSSGKSDDPFWETALDMLIFNVIDLCKLAYGNISVQELYNIVQTIPKGEENITEKSEDGKIKPFQKAFEAARQNVTAQIDNWFGTLPFGERNHLQEVTPLKPS